MSPDLVAILMFMIVACVIVPAALYYRQRAAELQYWKMINGTRSLTEYWGRANYLLRGLVWLAVGIGISILFVVMYRVEQDPGLLAMATLGSIPAGVGVAHLVVHRLQPKPAPSTSNQPGRRTGNKERIVTTDSGLPEGSFTLTAEQEILQQEEQLANAKRTLDLDALQRIYADDLIMTGVLGEPTCGKAAMIDEAKRGITQRQAAAASGRDFEASAQNEDMKVTAHGDTAISSYRFIVRIKGQSIDVHRRYRTTNVWMKRGGRWQIVAGHMAFILDANQAAVLTGEGRQS